jgi:hypothetical protein
MAEKQPKQPEPVVKLSLENLGFPGVSANFLAAGASMLTIHLLDDRHMLVTFGLRGLVPRVQGDPVDDDDRQVQAEVVELPSGKVVAKTVWHMHDHGRYLWSLGQGRFLVRIGTVLSTFAPLVNLGDDPFLRTTFPYRGLRPTAVFVSPDAGMLMIEAERPPETSGGARVATWGDSESAQTGVVIDFFRISGAGSAASPVTVTATRAVKAPRPMLLAVDRDGYLWAKEDQRDMNQWTFAFDGFGGRSLDVGTAHSTCEPRLQLLSGSQYLLVTCNGGDDQLKLSEFGFDGHESWEEPVGAFTAPAFAFAPQAGRFAFVRTMAGVTDINSEGGRTAERQELRVYQAESGDLLLKAACNPVIKTAENFDLSSDGRTVALVREGAVWIYKLGAPTSRDQKDLEEVAKFTPPSVAADAPVTLAKITLPPPTQPGEIPPGNAAVVAAPVQTPVGGVAGGAVGGAAGAEAVPVARKPPTLLNPGEQPEFKDKSTSH